MTRRKHANSTCTDHRQDGGSQPYKCIIIIISMCILSVFSIFLCVLHLFLLLVTYTEGLNLFGVQGNQVGV